MTSRLSRKALLASLFTTGSALVAAGDAQADIIVTKVSSGGTVDYMPGPGFSTPYVSPNGNNSYKQSLGLPGTAAFSIRGATNKPNTTRGLQLNEHAGTKLFGVRTNQTNSFPYAKRFSKGQKTTFSTHQAASHGALLNANTVSNNHGQPKFTSSYFAFTFTDTNDHNQLDHGWIEGSLSNNQYGAMNFQITAFAFDDTGANIAMGQTVPSSVPEPSSMALGALGALLAGAVGMRRWRKLKADQAQTPATA
jgi:hypothetical protein